MKKTFLLPIATGCMMLIGTVAFAQAPAAQAAPSQQQVRGPKLTPEQRVEQEIAKLDAAVKLTADQQAKVKQLFTNIETQREQNKAAANGDRDKIKELNKGLAEQRKEGLKTILTVQQHEALKAANKEKKAEMMQNGQPAPNR